MDTWQRLRHTAYATFGCFVLAAGSLAAAAPAGTDAQQLDEVEVLAKRLVDPRTLDRVIVARFIDVHAIPNARQNQIGRWWMGICPETQGLQPAGNDFITHRVLEVARRVGAPTAHSANCQPNVDIIFTTDPQRQLDFLVEKSPDILGFHYPPQRKQLATVTHGIQAWYITGARSKLGGNNAVAHGELALDGLVVDSPYSQQAAGMAGSRLGNSVRSEFVRVTVLVDADVATHSSRDALANYIALLVLTRANPDGCNELPSILDFLSSSHCDRAQMSESMTQADDAFLRALYSSRLESTLGSERGEIHDAMAREIAAQARP